MEGGGEESEVGRLNQWYSASSTIVASVCQYLFTSPHSNLDERTREVYHENIQMAEALSLHMEHEATLRKGEEQLEMANRQLVAEKELHQQMVKEKIAQARHHKKLIRELQVRWVGGGTRLFIRYSSCACSVELRFTHVIPPPLLHHQFFLRTSQEKVQGLEQSLGVVVREFEEEKRRAEERHLERLQLAR